MPFGNISSTATAVAAAFKAVELVALTASTFPGVNAAADTPAGRIATRMATMRAAHVFEREGDRRSCPVRRRASPSERRPMLAGGAGGSLLVGNCPADGTRGRYQRDDNRIDATSHRQFFWRWLAARTCQTREDSIAAPQMIRLRKLRSIPSQCDVGLPTDVNQVRTPSIYPRLRVPAQPRGWPASKLKRKPRQAASKCHLVNVCECTSGRPTHKIRGRGDCA